MRQKIITHLQNLFTAHTDLAQSSPDDAFAKKLPVPSNTIGGQFWCLSCSLPYEQTGNKQAIIQALDQAAQKVTDAIANNLDGTESRQDLLPDLLEHESQHQGRLIRYVYGLGYTFPKSWVERWALGK